jgi:ferredoxin-type protein NapH
MARKISWGRWRRLAQISIVILYIAVPLLNRAEHHQVVGTLAALRIGPIDLIEPAGALSAALAGRLLVLSLLVGLLPIVLMALVAGPVFCSWVCPWGLLSEMIDKVKQKLHPRPWQGRGWVRLRTPRFTLLGVLFALGALAGIPIVAILSAPRLVTTLPAELLYLRMLSLTTGGLLLLLLIFELVGPRRLWCRALCPVGAFANLVRTRKTLSIRYDAKQCLHETPAACHAGCPWGLDPRQIKTFDGCTNCMVCVEGCPGAALHPGFGS